MLEKLNLEGTWGGAITDKDLVSKPPASPAPAPSVPKNYEYYDKAQPKPTWAEFMNKRYSGGIATGANGTADNNNATANPSASTNVEDAYKTSMDAANARLKQAYEYQQSLLAKEKDNALREAYIKQQMTNKAYPEQLSAAGINGGAAQAIYARNNADYANQRGAIQGSYLDNLGAAGQNYQQGVLQNNENFLAAMAAYQQAKDEERRKFELDMLKQSGLFNHFNGGIGLNGLKTGTMNMTANEYLNALRNAYGNVFD